MEGVQVVGNSQCSVAFREQYSLQVSLEHGSRKLESDAVSDESSIKEETTDRESQASCYISPISEKTSCQTVSVIMPTILLQGRSRRSGHGLKTFSATNFFWYSLPLKVIAWPTLPYDSTSALTTCPDLHFSKADYDRAASEPGAGCARDRCDAATWSW